MDFNKLRKKNIELTKSAVKQAVTRDLLVIQAVDCIEEIDRVSNVIVNRLREWYGYYNPEFTKSIHSNAKFVELVLSMSRKDLLRSLEISEDDSMGADLKESDLSVILDLAKLAQSNFSLRSELESYACKTMSEVCPNVLAITGTLVGAKLISFAGSLKRLSELPASTIQLLGAEKALFRHIRGEGKSPKHGIIVQHPLMEGAKPQNKGRIARALADKISIAAKVDYFHGNFIGDKLRKELEARFK